MKRILIIAIMGLTFITACTDDDSGSPVAPESTYTISIGGLPDSLASPEGYPQNISFTASVSRSDGSPAEGATVSLDVTSGAGSVSPSQGVTDAFGQVDAVYSVETPFGVSRAVVSAQAEGATTSATIDLIGTYRPDLIRLFSDTPHITVIENQDATIEVIAAVVDSVGRAVPGVDVEFSISPFTPGAPVFGSIEQPPPTDRSGVATAVFSTRGGQGSVIIRALHSIPDADTRQLSAELELKVETIANSIGSLTVIASPDFIYARHPDSLYHSTITATVVDLEGVAIPNFQLEFRTDMGALTRPGLTDRFGNATSTYSIRPAVDFPDPNEMEMTATILASIPGTNFVRVAEVTIQKSSNEPGTLQLISDRSQIYADQGLTFANLTALLKDIDNQPIANAEIVFTTNHGTVMSPVITDSVGIARGVFTDIGLPSLDVNGNIEPALIFAKYREQGLEAVVEITILRRNPVTIISLVTSAQQLIAGRGDTTDILVMVIQENGDRAPDGTAVWFMVERGRIVPNPAYTVGGGAHFRYFPSQQAGSDRLRAYVINYQGGVPDTTWSNEVIITLLPGPPHQITLRTSPDPERWDPWYGFLDIIATVSDTFGNPVIPGTLVNFTSTLGQIAESAVTDTAGRARVRLIPGVYSGFATITATVSGPNGPITAQVTVQFIAGNPNSIELRVDPRELDVAGTGGCGSATIFATVRDPNGNLVGGVVPVYFELIRQPPQPRGCNINQHGQIDSAFTQNGVARATLNSGTQSGGVLIKAYTWRDPETRLRRIEAVTQAVVVSGPPELLDIDVDNRGEDAGGGTWAVEVSARVYDFYRNPVPDSIPVSFTVEPDFATIGVGYTRNENRFGESWPGLAFASMTYNSDNSFDTLEITAIVETEAGQRTTSIEYTLPLQQGALQLYVSPSQYRFEDDEDICSIRCWTILQDGHEIRISNAPVLYSTTAGNFYRRDDEGNFHRFEAPEPAIAYTPDAVVYLRGVQSDFFNDPFQQELSVQIEAEVVGYEEAAARPRFVIMTRR